MSESIGAEDWAGQMGERWLANVDAYESMLLTVGKASLAHAGFGPGERVIDIGCGGGWTTRQIAASVSSSVAPHGGVLGLDISAPLIVEARRRAADAGLANIGFIAQDAATATPPGAPYDRLYSRFGSMFFAQPAAAFVNLHAMLRPGGRADFAVWQPPAKNAWVGEMMAIVRAHIDLPKPEPHAPGPFALDDPHWFRGLLEPAGFRAADFHSWSGQQFVGGEGRDADAAAEFVLRNTHFADALQSAPAATQAIVRGEIVALFQRHETPAGVAMPAAAWFVSARA
jgi:protein-L-isoaspartate O-methyltransferase